MILYYGHSSLLFFLELRYLTFLQVPSPENIQPDTEQNVCDEAEDVFKNFLYQSWRQDQSRQDFDNTPNVPQLTNFTADPLG